REAVDVFGDPELGDPALLRALAVALHIGLAVVLGGARVALVGAQVQVIVGEHRRPAIQAGFTRAASSSSARRMSSGVVTLRFSSLAATTITRPPARS